MIVGWFTMQIYTFFLHFTKCGMQNVKYCNMWCVLISKAVGVCVSETRRVPHNCAGLFLCSWTLCRGWLHIHS